MGKKKKPTADRHTTSRVNVGVPEPWHAVMRRIAAENRQPVLYLLIELVAAEAERRGHKDVPKPPWTPDSPESS